MTASERWRWHAEVYAFRRVHLGVSPDERASPPDPDGVWFNERLVDEATRLLRDKRERSFRRREWARADLASREAPAVCDRWARGCGFPNFAAAEEAGYTKFDVGIAIAARATQSLAPPSRGPGSIAATLGVRAREYTPEEMRAGRAALVDYGMTADALMEPEHARS